LFKLFLRSCLAAEIIGNIVEGNQGNGIEIFGGVGAFIEPTGTSSDNVVAATIAQNTVKSQAGVGIFLAGGKASEEGGTEAVANNNQVSATVVQNTVEDSGSKGISFAGGFSGQADSNTVSVLVKKNTACDNTDADIEGVGGFLGNDINPPNQGTGNTVKGLVVQNTATTVIVEDGIEGNQAEVIQFGNLPCP
jgi:hypothetical protein